MKRTLLLFIACAVLLSLTACGDVYAGAKCGSSVKKAVKNLINEAAEAEA